MRTLLPYLIICWLWVTNSCLSAASLYDPLQRNSTAKVTMLDLTVHDSQRQRDIPLRVYLPTSSNAEPVLLFSHGLGGSRDGNAFMGQHWAARGYVVIMLQHAGSDAVVWQRAPLLRRKLALRRAATAENLLLRVGDVSATLDQLARWQSVKDHPLAGRLDMQHIGMSGHSFGALTTQALSGQLYRHSTTSLRDPRISAAIAFSPSITARASAADFAAINMPWLAMTGTLDTSPIGDADVAARRAVYTALPPGDKYELVLNGAEHSAFTDRPLPGDKAPRNPNHHRAILAISTAFWDAYLRQDTAASVWLKGDAVRSVLQAVDSWQHK